MIQLLNKEDGFSEIDKENIELFAKVAVTILDPQDQEATEEALQEKFDHYLIDKKLFIMDDGSVYYKILDMQRDHYIGADQCYLLKDTPKETEIYHYNSSDEFLSIDMLVKIDEKADAILVSDRARRQKFVRYPLEKD